MRLVSMIFLIGVGAVIQAVFPVIHLAGGAKAPLLLSIVIYYALIHDRTAAMYAGLFAGVIQDSMGRIPLGYTAFCFLVVALLLASLKEELFVYEWSTHVFVGAVSSFVVTLFLYFLLVWGQLIQQPFVSVIMRLTGSFILGGITAPFVFYCCMRLEQFVGVIEMGGQHGYR